MYRSVLYSKLVPGTRIQITLMYRRQASKPPPGSLRSHAYGGPLFTAFGFAALLGPMLTNALLTYGGYSLVYTVLALMSAASFTLCRLFL